MRTAILLALFLAGACTPPPALPPNIVLIVADDLGYGDIGAYGQRTIQTPHLDRLAAEGMRFTHFYAGSTVCAPSRAVLMTGQHLGHQDIRGNRELPIGQQPLPAERVTVAERLAAAGYDTALIGKWGLGAQDTEGHPSRQGFATFFGYLDQRHAHNYYPEFLFRNEERIEIPGNRLPEPRRPDGAGQAIEKGTYSPDLLVDEALAFIDTHAGTPFFLVFAPTLPHANNEAGIEGMEVPDFGTYADRPWPAPQKGLAAMVTRLDEGVGRLLERLHTRGIDEQTVVFFTSDNGPHAEGGNDPEFFDSNGPLRGTKRDLFEGGIRIPFIARWPGRIPAGATSSYPGYHGDFFATAVALAGHPHPDTLDSVSLLPALTDVRAPIPERYLYWEFYEQGSRQAVREGRWKAIRQPMFTGPVALFDLEVDEAESTDLAGRHPDIARQMAARMEEAHVPHPLWVVR
jgi:uncharacterized sulfatase